jgi:hypothetical protein
MVFSLAVVGSRSITDSETVETVIGRSPWVSDSNIRPIDMELEVVSGGADGVDTAAQEWAERQGFDTLVIEPDWDDWSDGHPALHRNTTIIKQADAVIAVWDGHSDGTKDSIDKAIEHSKPLYVEIVD